MDTLTKWETASAGRRLGMLLALACIGALLIPVPVLAGPPLLGEYFYGATLSGGQPFGGGTPVTVAVNGVFKSYVQPATVDALGRYGYTPSELLVPGDTAGLVGAVPGDRLSFYLTDGARTLHARLYDVGQAKWFDDVPFVSGASAQHLDLVTPMITTTVAAGGGGTIDLSGRVPVGWHGSQAFHITAGSGYDILDVQVDGVSVGARSAYTFTNITADHALVASFKLATSYTLTPGCGSGGRIEPSTPQAVPPGGSLTFHFFAEPGYEVEDVKIDGISVGAVTEYTFTGVTAQHTIDVTFRLEHQSLMPMICDGHW